MINLEFAEKLKEFLDHTSHRTILAVLDTNKDAQETLERVVRVTNNLVYASRSNLLLESVNGARVFFATSRSSGEGHRGRSYHDVWIVPGVTLNEEFASNVFPCIRKDIE